MPLFGGFQNPLLTQQDANALNYREIFFITSAQKNYTASVIDGLHYDWMSTSLSYSSSLVHSIISPIWHLLIFSPCHQGVHNKV